MDEDLKDLLAMVLYDPQSKSIMINICGFRNDLHGKHVSDWVLDQLNIDALDLYSETPPTIH